MRSRSLAKTTAFPLCAVAALLWLAACGGGGGSGTDGQDGAPGASTGTLSGTVVNSLTSLPLSGCTVNVTPVVQGLIPPVTGPTGAYAMTLPVGQYTVTTSGPTNYSPKTGVASVLAAQTTTLDLAVAPTSAVKVTVTGTPTSPAPGATFTLTGAAQVYDGSTITGWQWTQTSGATATVAAPGAAATDVTLATGAAYKTAMLADVEELERWRVMPVNPHAEGSGSTVKLDCTVTTTSGTYKATATVVAAPPFLTRSSGIQNVPVGIPVLLGGKTQASYDWVLETVPSGSTATMQDGNTRYPWFRPDVTGTYGVRVTDLGPSAVVRFNVYAGLWYGAIGGQDGSGNPTVASECTLCHSPGGYYPEKFTAWTQSGHARIFSDNLNTSDHYSSGCFECHTVGYNPDVANNGIDDATDYATFYATMWPGGHLTANAGNWTQVLTSWPGVARYGNIQCENCHGPNGTGSAHVLLGVRPDPRVSLASEVCGQCHGEPPRHGRFQQWEESGHGNYELAIDEGMSTSCARCHSAQGYLVWLPRLEAGNFGSLLSGDITWNAESVHPITCAVCHDPHDVGTVSGDATDAPVRVEGDTPALPSGYTATSVGKGAMCITCHNTRNGQRDDASYTGNADDRAPHVASQGDVLLGYNAYFVGRGLRGSHSFLDDTCVTCHMEATPPPAGWSYNLSGTNHSFSASLLSCTVCHGEFDGGTIKEYAEARLEEFRVRINTALKDIVTKMLTPTGGETLRLEYVVVGPTGTETTFFQNLTSADTINAVEVQDEFHGRQSLKVQATLSGTTTPVWFENVQMAKADFLVAGQDILHVLYGQTVARAGWNYYLLHGDGSHAIHNPDFFTEVIAASIAALNAAD